MSERTQRRLAAIATADVAGYSRLVGADEEGTLNALRSHRRELIDPLIEEHGGRNANTAGDSLLLEFPSAVDAVRCTLAVQKGMADRNANLDQDKQILFRVGINVGDVVAEGGDLLGDGVNIAARVESLASPGGIAISVDAYRQVRDRLDIEWQDSGEHEVKNIARPVRVWRWAEASVAQVYTVYDIHFFLGDEIVARGAAAHGLTWYYARPRSRASIMRWTCVALRSSGYCSAGSRQAAVTPGRRRPIRSQKAIDMLSRSQAMPFRKTADRSR